MDISKASYWFKGREVEYNENNDEILGKWVYGLLSRQVKKTHDSPVLSCITPQIWGVGEKQVKTETVCQSTGLLAGHKRLYEHDIVIGMVAGDFLIYHVVRGCDVIGGHPCDTGFMLEGLDLTFIDDEWRLKGNGIYGSLEDWYEGDELQLLIVGNKYDDKKELAKNVFALKENFEFRGN